MSPRARRRGWIALLILVVVVILLLLSRCSPDSADPGTERTPGGGADTSGTGRGITFTVTGSTTHPISPGTSAPVNLVLTNSHGYPLVATDLKITIREVVAPRADKARPCTVDDFILTQVADGVVVNIPGGGAASLRSAGIDPSDWPLVGMTNTSFNQDGCKGATLRFDHTASGRRASR